jgi:hypothetical protein
MKQIPWDCNNDECDNSWVAVAEDDEMLMDVKNGMSSTYSEYSRRCGDCGTEQHAVIY